MNFTNKKLLKIYVIAVLLNTVIFSFVLIFFPESSDFLFAEDNLIEILSAFFYIVSFFVGIYSIILLKEKRHRKYYIILPILSLIFFTEEIDFAKRILNFDSPFIYHTSFGSIHDIIPIAHEYLQEHIRLLIDFIIPEYLQISTRFLVNVFFIIFFIVFFIFLWKYRKYLCKLNETLRKYPSIGLLLVAIGFLSCVQVFDFHFIKSYKSYLGLKIEELFEMNGALTVLFASLSAVHTSRIDEQSKAFESKQLKHMPVFIAASLSFFMFMGVTTYFVFNAYVINIENDSRKYMKKVFPLIFYSWDSEAFIENLPPKLALKNQDEFKEYFSGQLQVFGSLKHYRLAGSQFGGKRSLHIKLGSKNKTIVLEKAIIFKHNIIAVFENAQATIQVDTVMLEQQGRWRIAGMKIDSIK